MRTLRLVLPCLAALLAAAPAGASPADAPRALDVKEGAKLEIGRPFKLRLLPVPSAASYTCHLEQGEIDDAQSAPAGPHPACTMALLDEVASPLRPGPATITITISVPGAQAPASTTLNVELVARPIRGDAGKQYDSDYWSDNAGGNGYLTFKTARVKNGVLEVPLWVGETIFLGNVHAKIEADGHILPQVVAVGPGIQTPDTPVTPAYREEADLTKSVLVAGMCQDRGREGHGIQLVVYGAKIGKVQSSHDATLIRQFDHGAWRE